MKKANKIRLLLTGKCTARCDYCHNEGQSTSAPLLKLSAIKKYITELENNNALPEEVVLTGGEPTINKEVAKIAQFLKSKNIYVSMASHAGHPDLLEPVLPYIDELKIHLDSFDPELQFKSMGIPLEAVLKSIKLAKKYSLKLLVNHPLNNEKETKAFVVSARQKGIDVKIIELYQDENFVSLNAINWETFGYEETQNGYFKHKTSNHKLFFKRCGAKDNDTGTIFYGTEGIRSAIEKDTTQVIQTQFLLAYSNKNAEKAKSPKLAKPTSLEKVA